MTLSGLSVETRIIARTAGLALLGPPVEEVYGISVESGPLASAYTQWDPHATPVPADVDVPPADNCAHEAIRRLPELQEQLKESGYGSVQALLDDAKLLQGLAAKLKTDKKGLEKRVETLLAGSPAPRAARRCSSRRRR